MTLNNNNKKKSKQKPKIRAQKGETSLILAYYSQDYSLTFRTYF